MDNLFAIESLVGFSLRVAGTNQEVQFLRKSDGWTSELVDQAARVVDGIIKIRLKAELGPIQRNEELREEKDDLEADIKFLQHRQEQLRKSA